MLILITAFIPIVSIRAQEPNIPTTTVTKTDTFVPDTEKLSNLYNNGIGIRYSNISGYGLSYLRRFLDDYTVCINGAITYNEYEKWTDMSKTNVEEDTKNILYNFGIEFQRDLFVTTGTKIYGLIGMYYTDDDNKGQDNSGTVNKTFSIGVGFGFQWYMGKHVAGYFHFGYKFDNIDSEENNQPSLQRQTVVGFGLGMAILF